MSNCYSLSVLAQKYMYTYLNSTSKVFDINTVNGVKRSREDGFEYFVPLLEGSKRCFYNYRIFSITLAYPLQFRSRGGMSKVV